jgi:hypothetical protein
MHQLAVDVKSRFSATNHKGHHQMPTNRSTSYYLIYPRLAPGGFMVFDDYGFKECQGARLAVDEYFEDKPEFPIALRTGQALVCKLHAKTGC